MGGPSAWLFADTCAGMLDGIVRSMLMYAVRACMQSGLHALFAVCSFGSILSGWEFECGPLTERGRLVVTPVSSKHRRTAQRLTGGVRRPRACDIGLLMKALLQSLPGLAMLRR